MKKIKILATIGPSSFNKDTIKTMDKNGVDIFRINLSHTKIDDLENQIKLIQNWTKKSICLDSEGAQIRTGHIDSDTLELKKNDVLRIGNSNEEKLYFTPKNIIFKFEKSDLLKVDFNDVVLEVTDVNDDHIITKVTSSGTIGKNKAVTCSRKITLPAITTKDKQAIEIANNNGVDFFALSFVHTSKDIKELKKLLNSDINIIAKIETKESLNHLDDIISESNAILIDRGDLSREILLEQIPMVQKQVISYAKQHNHHVYVATNLLESMITNKSPNVAEVNDIFNTLMDGANGLVLAAETAIGSNPLLCINMINKSIIAYNEHRDKKELK